MNVNLRLRLIAIGCAVAAVWLGWELADESYAIPFIVVGAAIFGILMALLKTPMGAIALGLALFGYLVGNRGFAQLRPAPWLPLFPAEFVLLVAGGWWLVQCAFEHRLPFRRDALNWLIVVWLALGTARMLFDVRLFGLMAARDYAMIYYALYFFLAQHLAGAPESRRFLVGILALASVVQPVTAMLAEAFPEFFLNHLLVRGVPLIYLKGDLALTFMAVSALLLAFIARGPARWWAWSVAAIELVYVVGSSNRASMLGALVALGWLALSRMRRFVLVQIAVFAAALLVVSSLALLTENTWSQRKLRGISERFLSLGDVVGAGTYVSDDSFMKGDNNRFRSVWWRTVVAETMATNPALGLGFGHDLARNFLQEYNPDMAEDFSARSPHNIAVSVIGRMGLVGLAVFVLLCLAIAVRTFRAMRDPNSEDATLGLWAGVWVILVSAGFGVVLEGPMGAVVFWSLLGIAHAKFSSPAEVEETSEAEILAASSSGDLQSAATKGEVALRP